MRTLRRTTIVTAVAAAALFAATTPASAAWYTPNDDYTSNPAATTMKVEDVARVSKDGFAVTWPVQFTCPKGEDYTLYLQVDERDSPLVPPLMGEDQGISSSATFSGVCKGTNQSVKTPLPVHPTTLYQNGDPITVNVPIGPSTHTNTVALLTTDAGYLGWCAAPACAGTTGPQVVIR